MLQALVAGRQKRLTRRFSWTESCEPAIPKVAKSETWFTSPAEAKGCTAPIKRRLSPKLCWSPGGSVGLLVVSVPEKRADSKITSPWKVLFFLPKKGQQRDEKLWILVFYICFWKLETWSFWFANLLYTLFLSRSNILAKRLRAPSRQQIPKSSAVTYSKYESKTCTRYQV